MFSIPAWCCKFLPLSHCRLFYSCVNNWFIVIVVSGADTKSKLTWRKRFGSAQTHLYFSNGQRDQRRKHNCFTEFETNFSIFFKQRYWKEYALRRTLVHFSWGQLLTLVVWRCFGSTTLPGWFGLEFKQKTPTCQENSYGPGIYLRDHSKRDCFHNREDAVFPACSTPQCACALLGYIQFLKSTNEEILLKSPAF